MLKFALFVEPLKWFGLLKECIWNVRLTNLVKKRNKNYFVLIFFVYFCTRHLLQPSKTAKLRFFTKKANLFR